MIIYGWSTKNIKQAPLADHECPQCHQKQSVLVIVAKYAHIFWIPVFPFGKTATIVCSNCKHEIPEKAISLGPTVSIKQLKAAVPIPKYLFIGLALIVGAIGYFIFDSAQEDQRKASYVETPQVGDVYLIKNPDEPSEFKHYLMKIRDVAGDSIWVSYSSYNYNGIVSKLDPNDGFYDIMYAMHKDGIREINDAGDLIKVMRDYSSSSGFDREIQFVEPDVATDSLEVN